MPEETPHHVIRNASLAHAAGALRKICILPTATPFPNAKANSETQPENCLVAENGTNKKIKPLLGYSLGCAGMQDFAHMVYSAHLT